MTTWSDYCFGQCSAADCDHDLREPRAAGHRPREYVTEVSVSACDDGRQALYSPGLSEPAIREIKAEAS